MHLGNCGLPFGESHLDPELIAGNHGLPKFGFFDGSKQDQLLFPVGQGFQHENTSDLSHRFHYEYARHDRKSRKMTIKKRLICGDILQPDNRVLSHFQDAIDQQHRVAVRQNLPDILNVHHRHVEEAVIITADAPLSALCDGTSGRRNPAAERARGVRIAERRQHGVKARSGSAD